MPASPQFGCLLKEVTLQDVTTGQVLFDDSFSRDNIVYVPPRCGKGSYYIYGYGFYYGSDCYYLNTCLSQPPPVQAPDPNPLPDIEATGTTAAPPSTFTSTKQASASCPTGFVNLSDSPLVPVGSPNITGPSNIQGALDNLLFQLPLTKFQTTTTADFTMPAAGAAGVSVSLANAQSQQLIGGDIIIDGYPVVITALGSGNNITIINQVSANAGVVVPSGSPLYVLGQASGNTCPQSDTVSTVVQGQSGAAYTTTLLVQGVVELKPYTDPGCPCTGSVVAGTSGSCFQITSPMPTNGEIWSSNLYNEYLLIISDPPQVYALNNGPEAASGPGSCNVAVISFELTVPIAAGATVTLAANSIDGAECPNCDPNQPSGCWPITIPYPTKPLQVTQPYVGQFAQINVLSVTGGTNTTGLPYTVELTFASAQTAANYSITNNNYVTGSTTNLNYPTAWTVSGSNDGQNWTILDERAGMSFVPGQTLRFPIESPASYLYYEVEITATSDGNSPNIQTPAFFTAAPAQVFASATGTGTTQAAADAAATAAAQAAATAMLNCASLYTSTQSYDSGGQDYTATATSYNSQQEANAAALALAMALAA